jgi:hypothetical protein
MGSFFVKPPNDQAEARGSIVDLGLFFFQPNENDPVVTEAVRYSVIGTFVPAVSWNFKF